MLFSCPEGEITMINGYYDPADYDGLTTEEITAMRKDTEKERFKAGSNVSKCLLCNEKISRWGWKC